MRTSLLGPAELQDIQPVEFPFFGNATYKLLAADDSATYSLKQLVESLKNYCNIWIRLKRLLSMSTLPTDFHVDTTAQLTYTWIEIIQWIDAILLTV
jgi:hypothetical protein